MSAGAGGVLSELGEILVKSDVARTFEIEGFEIVAEAVVMAQERFPSLKMTNEFFGSNSGDFDISLLVDVLKHLENPWEMLRLAADKSECLVVRQPLLESDSTFRHRNYELQRQHWGHIAFFNYHSFMDMAAACRWRPLHEQLVAPWELHAGSKQGSFLKSLLVSINRVQASHFLPGFYLLAAFVRSEKK